MTLVDTSVWVGHLRAGSERLKTLLSNELVLCHPFIVGELACGALRNRQEILDLLAALPEARLAEHQEALHLLEERHLYARGLGWVDVHLLASALLTGCALWTLDRPLRNTTIALKISG